jgi:NAD+-dependent protein deacetylase sirtuin 4
MGLMRIPYTDPLPAPRIIPAAARSFGGAVAALSEFLAAGLRKQTPRAGLENGRTQPPQIESQTTVLLTGAGISVASGLADYRGENGTYTLNKLYRPIYYHEFVTNHEARKRYWARSFLGWPNLENARPNAAHRAVGKLGELSILSSVITQSMSVSSIYTCLCLLSLGSETLAGAIG